MIKNVEKRYEAVIFDLDGTLLNTLEDLQASVNYAMKCHNMPEHSLEEIRCFVGNGIEKLIERAVVENTEESVRKAFLLILKYITRYIAMIKRGFTREFPLCLLS